MLRGRLLAFVVGTAVAITAAPAAAATLKVTTTFDEVNAGDGACSLREAIAAIDSPGSANGDCSPAAFGTNTIVLGPQTYPSVTSSRDSTRSCSSHRPSRT